MAEGESGETHEAPRWRGLLQLAVIVAVVLAATLLARAPRQEFLELDADAGRLGVQPATAVMQQPMTSAAHRLALTGSVTTLGNVAVIPEASGDVVFGSESFRPGGAFAAGEVLARVDTAEYDIGLAMAKLDLDYAEAHLKEVKDRHGPSAEYYATQPNGTVHPWPALDGAIEKAEALVETARHRVTLAEIQLDQTRIRMPFDGYLCAGRCSGARCSPPSTFCCTTSSSSPLSRVDGGGCCAISRGAVSPAVFGACTNTPSPTCS